MMFVNSDFQMDEESQVSVSVCVLHLRDVKTSCVLFSSSLDFFPHYHTHTHTHTSSCGTHAKTLTYHTHSHAHIPHAHSTHPHIPHPCHTTHSLTFTRTPQEYKLLHPVQVNADTRQAKETRRAKNDQSKATTRHSLPKGDVKVAVQPVVDGVRPLHTPSSGVAR